MSGSVLVIGYGNALRSDDGVGPAVASALSSDVRAFGLTVLQRHQLTPDLAPEFAAAWVSAAAVFGLAAGSLFR